MPARIQPFGELRLPAAAAEDVPVVALTRDSNVGRERHHVIGTRPQVDADLDR
jgi:hypothetical protein